MTTDTLYAVGAAFEGSHHVHDWHTWMAMVCWLLAGYLFGRERTESDT